MLRLLKLAKKKAILFVKIFILKKYEPIDLWFWKDGDVTLRLDYPLKESSLVFDLGGYQGDWTDKIYRKYKSNIWVFEPVKYFSKQIENRFQDMPSIRVFNFGLSDHNGSENINLQKDGTSLFNSTNSNSTEIISIKDINEFIKERQVQTIDLMKINIEGTEYKLLEALIRSGNITSIKYIQVQFHPWVPNAELMRENLRKELSFTHQETYNYPFVWENWELKE